jgi:hypothetical protein
VIVNSGTLNKPNQNTEQAALTASNLLFQVLRSREYSKGWWEDGGRGPFVAFTGLFVSDETEQMLENNLRSLDNSMEGEEGLKNFSKGVDWLGQGISLIPTPFTQALGRGLSLLSDGIDTGLDYKNLDAATATENLFLRGSSQLLQYGNSKLYSTKTMNFGGAVTPYVIENSTNFGLGSAFDDQIDKNTQESLKSK